MDPLVLKLTDPLFAQGQFLNDPNKGIVFHYTPKHASWMNQIEIWFGILMKKVSRRGHFLSKEDLKNKILTFIDYFNAAMAKPFTMGLSRQGA